MWSQTKQIIDGNHLTMPKPKNKHIFDILRYESKIHMTRWFHLSAIRQNCKQSLKLFRFRALDAVYFHHSGNVRAHSMKISLNELITAFLSYWRQTAIGYVVVSLNWANYWIKWWLKLRNMKKERKKNSLNIWATLSSKIQIDVMEQILVPFS